MNPTLIDGEIVAIDDHGRVSFNLLQHHPSKAQAIQFYAFDLLLYKGRSLSGVALETRQELLTEVLSTVGDPIRLSEHLRRRRQICFAQQRNIPSRELSRKEKILFISLESDPVHG